MGVSITALGQAGFDITGCDARVVIDPYLSDSVNREDKTGLFVRKFQPPVAPTALRGADVVLVTHDHGDHCDLGTLQPFAAVDDTCFFMGPVPALRKLRDAGIERRRLVEAVIDREYRVSAKCKVIATPAAHYDMGLDGEGKPGYVGYLVKMCGWLIYHAGDTIVFGGMELSLRRRAIDIALLPVNGRDTLREAKGIVGNMRPAEAMRLARSVGAGIVVPMHNDLFASNSVDDADVTRAWAREASGVGLRVLKPGETMRHACRCESAGAMVDGTGR